MELMLHYKWQLSAKQEKDNWYDYENKKRTKLVLVGNLEGKKLWLTFEQMIFISLLKLSVEIGLKFVGTISHNLKAKIRQCWSLILVDENCSKRCIWCI